MSGSPCSITPNNPPHRKSCWRGGSKEDRCNLSLAHTHPWFEWPKAKGVVCLGEEIEIPYHVDRWNAGGMEFSSADVDFVNLHFLEGHIGVSDRSCVRAVRRHGWKEPVSGTCTPKHRLKKYDTEGDD